MVFIVLGLFILVVSIALYREHRASKHLNHAPYQSRGVHAASMQHKEHIAALNRQAAAAEERNYYERGDSIYSGRHTDF